MILNITAFPVFRAKEYMGPIESSSSSMWGCDIRSQGGDVWWWFKGIWCPKNMILVLHFWWKWSWDLAPNAACFDESFRHRIETSEIFWVCWALEPQITWCSWQSFRPCGKVYRYKESCDVPGLDFKCGWRLQIPVAVLGFRLSIRAFH